MCGRLTITFGALREVAEESPPDGVAFLRHQAEIVAQTEQALAADAIKRLHVPGTTRDGAQQPVAQGPRLPFVAPLAGAHEA
jgi:hypothetical protein